MTRWRPLYASTLLILVLFRAPATAEPTSRGPGLVEQREDRSDELSIDSLTRVEPPVDGVMIQPFDPPEAPWLPGHRGVDLAAAPGTLVRTVIAGTVTYSGEINGVGWVTVDHGGSLETTYGPVVHRVNRGTVLESRQIIGEVAPDGEHLDWGARLAGEYIDPLLLLQRWSVALSPLN